MTQPIDAWSDKDGLRWYTYDNEDYLSVTSMRKALGMPYPLHNWTMNKLMDGVLDEPDVLARALAKEETEGARRIKRRDPSKPPETDEEAAVRARKAARSILRALSTEERDSSAERGTDIHAAIAEGKDVKTLPAEQQPYVEQYAKAVISLGIQPILTERQVFNRTLGYAGSFDLLARLARRPGSPVALIDLKTGKNTYAEHALQGYSYLKGEFVAEGSVKDDEATAKFKEASQIGVLRIGPEDWEYHDIRIDKQLHTAWYSMCMLSQFLLRNPELKTLEVR